jgi:hypothetical protein
LWTSWVASLEEEGWCAVFSDCCGYCVMLTQFSHTPHYQGSRSWGTSYRLRLNRAAMLAPILDPGIPVGNSSLCWADLMLACVGTDQAIRSLFFS